MTSSVINPPSQIFWHVFRHKSEIPFDCMVCPRQYPGRSNILIISKILGTPFEMCENCANQIDVATTDYLVETIFSNSSENVE